MHSIVQHFYIAKPQHSILTRVYNDRCTLVPKIVVFTAHNCSKVIHNYKAVTGRFHLHITSLGTLNLL
jgi:hypothetical protein